MTYRDTWNEMVKENEADLERGNIFLLPYIIPENEYERISIKQVMTRWGVFRHYEALIDRMSMWANERPGRMVVVQWDMGALNVDHDRQKMLLYTVSTNDGEFISNGGALFQHGKMSFHS